MLFYQQGTWNIKKSLMYHISILYTLNLKTLNTHTIHICNCAQFREILFIISIYKYFKIENWKSIYEIDLTMYIELNNCFYW